MSIFQGCPQGRVPLYTYISVSISSLLQLYLPSSIWLSSSLSPLLSLFLCTCTIPKMVSFPIIAHRRKYCYSPPELHCTCKGNCVQLTMCILLFYLQVLFLHVPLHCNFFLALTLFLFHCLTFHLSLSYSLPLSVSINVSNKEKDFYRYILLDLG